ncbi:MAG: cytidylate kinase-like family protein [Phycisphaeraceae bacterium]
MAVHTSAPPVGRSVLAAIRGSLTSPRTTDASSAPAPPFITISRAHAALHPAMLDQLLRQLNIHQPNPPWQCYDRELIEEVAHDHGLSVSLIQSLQEHPHSILEDILEGLRADQPRPPDEVVYAKVVATLRTLARAGRAVLVGRGGAFCTQDMPGGIHIRFVAPKEFRIRRLMQAENVDRNQAERLLHDADDKRRAFYTRFWRRQPDAADSCELFTLTINSAAVPLEIQVATITQLVQHRQCHVT